MTLSIVSHQQGALVAGLLDDLVRIDSKQVAAIVITRNLPEPPIAVPPGLGARVTTIDNAEPRGFGANHDAAFAHCTTPLFAVINPDIRLPVDPFDAIESAFGPAGGRVALVAPRIAAPDGGEEDSARALITPWRLFEHRVLARPRAATADFDWLAGMFMVVRSDAFREIGGFDSRYFMYCEDFDLCARLRLAGWALARETEVSVIHDAQRASHRSRRHLAWHVRSLIRMWTSSAFWRYRRLLIAEGR